MRRYRLNANADGTYSLSEYFHHHSYNAANIPRRLHIIVKATDVRICYQTSRPTLSTGYSTLSDLKGLLSVAVTLGEDVAISLAIR